MINPTAYGLGGALGIDLLSSRQLLPDETLQVCLLHMEPFQDCKEDELCDMHLKPSQVLSCPQRSLLIEALAKALCYYEDMLSGINKTVYEFPARMQKALNELALGVRACQELRPLRHLLASQGFPSDAKINAAMQTLTAMVHAFEPFHWDTFYRKSSLFCISYPDLGNVLQKKSILLHFLSITLLFTDIYAIGYV
jgi:hypothetical protein